MVKKRQKPSSAVTRSMTGYGSAEEKANGLFVGVDIRTVNNRYLKLQSRIPDELAPFAGPIEADVRDAIRRGSVFLTVRFEVLPEAAAALVNESLFASYRAVCRRLAAQHGLAGDVTVADVLGLPGVVRNLQAGSIVDAATVEPLLKRAASRALAALTAMREKEGAALRRELGRRLDAAQKQLTPIERNVPQAVRELEESLFERIRELAARRGLTLAPADVAREIACIAERTDMTEEIERLKSHFSQARELLVGGGDIGRQLDFLAQEMLREATTMGSKNGSTRLAEAVLALKVEIDRFKEQVQNVE